MKKEIHNNVTKIFYMIRYIWKYTPCYMGILLLQVLGNALWDILVGMLFLKYLFDAIEAGADYSEILYRAVIVMVYRLILILYGKWIENIYRPKANLKLHEGMQTELYQKARKLDLAYYDNPDFYNQFIWAIHESDTRAVKIMSNLSDLLSSMISLLGMSAVFLAIDWIAALAVLVSSALSFFIRIKANKIKYQKMEEMKPLIRKTDYITRVFYQGDFAKELRMGDMVKILQDDFDKSMDQKISCAKKYAPGILIVSLLSQLMTTYLFNIGIVGYLVVRYMLDSDFTLGGFSVGINATWKLFVQVSRIIDCFSRLNEDSVYADKFRTFTELEPQIKNGYEKAAKFETLEFQQVSFSYPFGNQKNREVLKNISFTIRKGEKIALVGYNGAGKTTLTKLAMRLYDVTGGSIKYNGKEIKEYDIESYRAHIGAVFQDYKIFAATVAENVAGGEYREDQNMEITEALKSAAFCNKLETLPKGIHTMLTREFDEQGVNLSGGEMQKIAIARAFAKPYDIIIMDEPSSALDPLAEYELNKVIGAAAKDKTMIFISHRLSTTRMADRIYMFDNGEIVEQGKHEDLMRLNGKYAQMFSIQAKKYHL